jgi:hypothetical protein
MKTITPAEVVAVINNIPKSAFFNVNFVKKNGEVREMNCRSGVTKHLTPPSEKKREKPVMPKNIVTVYDMKNAGYRHINTDTVLKIVAEGQTFLVK